MTLLATIKREVIWENIEARVTEEPTYILQEIRRALRIDKKRESIVRNGCGGESELWKDLKKRGI
jgi:hypothetical protein